MCPPNDCAFRASVWPSQWLCVPPQWLCVSLTMTLCDSDIVRSSNDFYVLQNDCMCYSQWHFVSFTMTSCTLSDFCAFMILYAHTRTLCGLIMTLPFPVNDVVIPSNEPCHHNSSCHAHAFCMTLTVTLCEMHNELLWCSQWFYVPSQWLCVNRQAMSMCVLTMTL